MDDQPILIYVTLGVSILLVISQAIPKILGPLGTAMNDWSRQRREVRIESRSADMIDVQRQVEYLTEQRKVDRLEHEREKAEQETEQRQLKDEFAAHRLLWAQREARWRGEWHAHRQWDYRAQEALVGHEQNPGLPPSFMTPDGLEDSGYPGQSPRDERS